MKTLILLILSILVLPSCTVRFVDQYGRTVAQHGTGRSQGHYPQGGGQQVQTGVHKKLESVTVTKSQTGYCEAWTPNTQAGRRQEIAEYAAAQYMQYGKVPSDSHLTQKYGFPCKARWVDTKDRVVGKVTVRPDEVPANIRARFQ